MAQHGVRPRTGFVVASGVLLAVLVMVASVAPVSASNMAFKMNKQIFALGPGVTGQNLVSLPDVNPYQGPTGLTQLCNALNLSTAGQIIQFEADTGNIRTFTCGQVQTFNLDPGSGLLITDTANTGGVVVGADIPGNAFDVFVLGPSPFGLNLFPVEYHTTAVTPEDVCQQCGLSNTASVTHFNAQTGNVFAHTCGQVPVYNLSLGAAVLIQDPQSTVTCTPPHF